MNKKVKIAIIVNSVFLVAGLICIAIIVSLTHHLASQDVATVWQGDSDIPFSQVSVFIPESEDLTVDTINTFRTQINTSIQEQIGTEITGFNDAFSCMGNVKITSDRATTDVDVIAVGGNFFDFHQLDLLSGNYIEDKDDDLNRVILDEELAWLLFGSDNLDEMEVTINGVPFYVSGVVSREDDYTTEKAYTSDMYLFMNYRTYANIVTGRLTSDDSTESTDVTAEGSTITVADPGITCYEIVLVNPVKNFALNLVTEKFPVKNVDIVENTGRYSLSNLFAILKDTSSSVIASNGVAYPYWENSARYTASKAALVLQAACQFILLPLITILILAIKGIQITNKKIKESKLSSIKDQVQEKIRVWQRKRWEKKHPDEL